VQKRKFNLKNILKAAGIPSNKYLLLTHRGYGKRGKIPENTIEAFQASTKLGFAGHELDVRLSRDGVAVIFHGPDLSTTTNGHGLIEEQNYEEFSQLNCGNYLQLKSNKIYLMPTLEEYLKKFGKRCFTNIEIKREWFNVKNGLEDKVIELISKYKCEKNVVISSFNLLSIYRIRKRYPDILAGVLIDKNRIPAIWFPLCIKILKPDSIHIHSEMASSEWIQYIKDKDCGVGLWGVNEKDQLRKFVASGVDILITDNMDLIKQKY